MVRQELSDKPSRMAEILIGRLFKKRKKKLHLEYGEKDFDLKLSKKSLPKFLPNVRPVIRKGYPLCGYMAAHTKEYVEEMETFICDEGI